MGQLTFLDEVGSPLPPGVFVSVYTMSAQNVQSASPVGTGYTMYGGVLNINLQPANAFIAYFAGTQAPKVSQIFNTSGSQPSGVYDVNVYDAGAYYDGNPNVPTQVTVYGYRSPYLSPVNYATAGSLLQPKGWYSVAAQAVGGNLHALLRGFLKGIAVEDANAQSVHETMRLVSCQGSEIDSWAYDMIGPQFPRLAGETDQQFVARLVLMMTPGRCSINTILAMVQAFYASVSNAPPSPISGQLAYGVAGGYDTAGGFNVNPPLAGSPPPPSQIYVWDGMTQPGLASTLGVVPTQFVIQVGQITVTQNELLAFNITGAYDVSGAFNVDPNAGSVPPVTPTPPDPRLGNIITLISKGASYLPLYWYNQTE